MVDPAAPSCDAGRIFPDERHSAHLYTRRRCRRRAFRNRHRDGSCTAGGAYVPAIVDEASRAQSRHDSSRPPLVKRPPANRHRRRTRGADVHSRQSGVTDHMQNEAMLSHARRIVATLKRRQRAALNMRESREPLFPPRKSRRGRR